MTSSPAPDDLSSMPLPADLAAEVVDLAAAADAQAAIDAADNGELAVAIADAILAAEAARAAGLDPLDAFLGD